MPRQHKPRRYCPQAPRRPAGSGRQPLHQRPLRQPPARAAKRTHRATQPCARAAARQKARPAAMDPLPVQDPPPRGHARAWLWPAASRQDGGQGPAPRQHAACCMHEMRLPPPGPPSLARTARSGHLAIWLSGYLASKPAGHSPSRCAPQSKARRSLATPRLAAMPPSCRPLRPFWLTSGRPPCHPFTVRAGALAAARNRACAGAGGRSGPGMPAKSAAARPCCACSWGNRLLAAALPPCHLATARAGAWAAARTIGPARALAGATGRVMACLAKNGFFAGPYSRGARFLVARKCL